MAEVPCETVTLAGAAETVKLATTRVTLALCVSTPSVAVVVMVSAEVPDAVREVGVKIGEADAGSPLTLKLTVPAYPFSAVTVAV